MIRRNFATRGALCQSKYYKASKSSGFFKLAAIAHNTISVDGQFAKEHRRSITNLAFQYSR